MREVIQDGKAHNKYFKQNFEELTLYKIFFFNTS